MNSAASLLEAGGPEHLRVYSAASDDGGVRLRHRSHDQERRDWSIRQLSSSHAHRRYLGSNMMKEYPLLIISSTEFLCFNPLMLVTAQKSFDI